MAGSLGQLNVSLTAETVQFISAMDKAAFTANMRMNQMQRNAKIAGAAIAASLVAAATGFAYKMKQVVDEADKMGKAAQSLGVTTEALSKLKYAAELSDISFEELSSSINRLNKAAAGGNTAFSALGINVKNQNGTLKDANQLISEIAEKFSQYNDGAAKSAIAMQIFGKSGAELIPLLNQGSKGLTEMGAEAEKFGIVIDSKMAKQSEALKDNMLRLNKALDGVAFTIGKSIIPVLGDMAEEFVNSRDEIGGLKDTADDLAFTLISAASGALILKASIDSLATNTAGAMAKIKVSGERQKTWLEVLANAHPTFGYLNAVQSQSQEALLINQKTNKDIQEEWANTFKIIDTLWTRHFERSNKGGGIIESTAAAAEKAKGNIESLTIAFRTLFNTAMPDVKSSLSSAFTDAIVQAKNFQDVLNSLLEDLLRIAVQRMIVTPFLNSIDWLNPAGGSSKSARGNVFFAGNMLAFANGGIIGGPTVFPMAGGRSGLAGENGIEAIMPLERGSNGKLGVKASGGRTQINIYTPANSKVSSERQEDGDSERINIFIDEAVAKNIRPGTSTFKALKGTFGLGQTLISR